MAKTKVVPTDRNGVRYTHCQGGGPWAGAYLAWHYLVRKDSSGTVIKPALKDVAPAIIPAPDHGGQYNLEGAIHLWRAYVELREAA